MDIRELVTKAQEDLRKIISDLAEKIGEESAINTGLNVADEWDLRLEEIEEMLDEDDDEEDKY